MLAEQDPNANAKFWLTVVDAGIKFVALLVGAAWTWMIYLRGRTFKHRPVLGTSGKLFKKNGRLYLSVICKLKNVGQSKYEIESKGTACQVWALTNGAPAPEELIWVSDVFTAHRWLEPGGQVDDPLLIQIPPQLSENTIVALRVGLRVVSAGVESNISSIVEVGDGPNSEESTRMIAFEEEGE